MSVPHTGKLIADVAGTHCRFDGDRWTSADAALASQLNAATQNSPATHFSISERAEHVLNKLGFQGRYQVIAFEADQWGDQLPPTIGID